MLATARNHTIPGWTELKTELDAWLALGMKATLWWRDDDATRPGPRLNRLLDCAETLPISLAVIPAKATSELAERLCSVTNISVLQHGYAHTNHAPAAEKKAEFGNHRPLTALRADLKLGRARLQELFGDQFSPIFVPPWNRFTDTLPAELAKLEFSGISSFGPRRYPPISGVLNCHIDIIDWHGTRGFLGTDAVLDQIVDHLFKRRHGLVDNAEPTGLLTHHRDHDTACWQFIKDLLDVTYNHPAADWRPSVQGIASVEK